MSIQGHGHLPSDKVGDLDLEVDGLSFVEVLVVGRVNHHGRDHVTGAGDVAHSYLTLDCISMIFDTAKDLRMGLQEPPFT